MNSRQVGSTLPTKPLASVPRPASVGPKPLTAKPLTPKPLPAKSLTARRLTAPPVPATKPPVTKPPLRSSAPPADDARRSRAPLKFHAAPTPRETPRSPSVARAIVSLPPSHPASSTRERIDPRARTLLATPAPDASVVPSQSRRMPPPLPVQAVERCVTLPDTELTEIVEMNDMLDDADVEVDVEQADIDVSLDEEPGATSSTTPPPAPSPRTSKKSVFAIIGGVIVSIAGMAAACFVLEDQPFSATSAASSSVAMATLASVRAPAPAPTPAQPPRAVLAAKTANGQSAHPTKPSSTKPKATPPKPPRATSKRGRPPVARAAAKKTGKAPAKKSLPPTRHAS